MLSPTQSPTTSWSEQAYQRLRELADQPVLLVLVLLAANAVARPYANITHDTLLYSIQVLNHVEHGAYDGDLYFLHGSQDEYSIFSVVVAPLVRLLGLRPAFFLVYLGCNILFVIGLVQLMGRLVEDRFIRVMSLIYLVIAPLNYGGHGVLHVHEAFLTPRLPAVGLVLMGLSRLLVVKAYFSSLLFMILAGSLHPLMAVGGFLVWGGVLLVDKLVRVSVSPKRKRGTSLACASGSHGYFAALAIMVMSIAGSAFLAIPSIATAVLGDMDDAWRQAIYNSDAFIFTAEWEASDWANVILGGASVIVGVYLLSPRVGYSEPWGSTLRKRLLAVVGLVGIAAVAGTMLAENMQYALLLLGQPYRALWIVRVFEVPLFFLSADRLFRTKQTTTQLLAFIPLIILLSSGPANLWLLEGAMPVFFLLPTLLVVRGLESKPRRPDWLVRGVAWSLLLGEIVWCTFRETLLVRGWSKLLEYQDAFELIHVLLLNLGVLLWMIIIIGSLLWLVGPRSLCLELRTRSMRATILAAIFLIVQTCFFVLPNTNHFRDQSQNLSDILFVREFLDEQPARSGKPTIYSAYGRVDYVWLELGADSYFDTWQMSGLMFRRASSVEGQRRAVVVGPFEIQRFREMGDLASDRIRPIVTRLFERGLDSPEPTTADLERLCAEPGLDYVILRQGFPGLYSATNGRVFVYDCQKVRTCLNLSATGVSPKQ